MTKTTTESAVWRAARAFRQAELDKRGDDWKYKPATIEQGFEAGFAHAVKLAREMHNKATSAIAKKDRSDLRAGSYDDGHFAGRSMITIYLESQLKSSSDTPGDSKGDERESRKRGPNSNLIEAMRKRPMAGDE